MSDEVKEPYEAIGGSPDDYEIVVEDEQEEEKGPSKEEALRILEEAAKEREASKGGDTTEALVKGMEKIAQSVLPAPTAAELSQEERLKREQEFIAENDEKFLESPTQNIINLFTTKVGPMFKEHLDKVTSQVNVSKRLYVGDTKKKEFYDEFGKEIEAEVEKRIKSDPLAKTDIDIYDKKIKKHINTLKLMKTNEIR